MTPPTQGPSSPGRRAELAKNLAQVRARIERACAAASRDPAEVSLVVVTKHFPASDAVTLHDLGVHDVGENRDQEAAEKLAEVRGILRDKGAHDLTLHFVGQLQSNKAAHVAGYADVVHSVDRLKLLAPLGRGASAAGRRLRVLVQVSLDDAPGRGGVPVARVEEMVDAVAGHDALHLRGVMAVAPLGVDPGASFRRLREVADGIQDRHPEASWISAGMSADLEAAVANGATHLRVGTAILGARPRNR